MPEACHYSITALKKKKKRAVQAIASMRGISIYKKSGGQRKKGTLIQKIASKSRKSLGLKKKRSVGPHLRYNPSKKCRSLVITKKIKKLAAKIAKQVVKEIAAPRRSSRLAGKRK
jgi:hypothetical protein